MKRLTLLLLLTLSIIGAKAQTTYVLNYDSIRVNKTAGTGGTSLYGKVYLKNVSSGLSSDSILTVRNGRIFKVPVSGITPDTTVYRTVANSRSLAQTQTALNLKANLASPTFTGTVTAPTFTGTLTGSITGNAATLTIADDLTTNASFYPTFVPSSGGGQGFKITSTKLTFNPSTGVLASTSFQGGLLGNATTATTLATGRTIAITGDIAYTSPSFDGSTNVTAAGTLATVNSNVGSFGTSTSIPSLTVNGKGLVTAVSGNAVIAPAGTLTGTTLASNVVTSSLTSLGVVSGTVGGLGGGLTVNGTGSGGIALQVGAVTKGYVYADASKIYIEGNSGIGIALTPGTGASITAPTQSANDNSTKVATTAYVDGRTPSGTYTPTGTAGSNTASVTNILTTHYIRVGNEVEVKGRATWTGSGTGNAIFYLSLPISSNMTSAEDLVGLGSSVGSNAGNVFCSGDATNDRATIQLLATFTTATEIFFSFTYTVK